MIASILIDQDQSYFNEFKITVNRFCPGVNLIGYSNSIKSACNLVNRENPDVVFLGLDNSFDFKEKLFSQFDSIGFETIIISRTYQLVTEALKCCAAGYLIYPIETHELLIAIQNARSRIEQKRERAKEKKLLNKFLRQLPSEEVIGVPTMDRFEFLKISEIIRCEGMQKCTRVVTADKTSIVSSYNLGEFRKKLAPYGFYSPHKSYLINLRLIRQYFREGSIVMIDGKSIPVAKRRKSEFLEQVKHI